MGLLQLFSFFLLLSLSHSESNGPRESVCSSENIGFKLKEGHGPVPILDEEKYKVSITLVKEGDNTPVDCVEGGKTKYEVIINATEKFKGFIITSTVPGTGYPANFVGKFNYRIWDYTTENLVRACENTMAHSDILKNNPVTLRWKSSSSARDVEFLFAIAFSRYVWIYNQSVQFPACKHKDKTQEKCINRTNLESASSGDDTSTSSALGSAQIENKCRPAKREIERTRNITLSDPNMPDHTIVYKCTGTTTRCVGKCAYCDESCRRINWKETRMALQCTTDDKDAEKKIISRFKVEEDLTCQCSCENDKCDTSSKNE